MKYSDRPEPQNHLSTDPKSLSKSILGVKWSCRWDVYRRLKALEIECQCSTNEPLLVSLHSPTTAIQVWSVLRQFNLSRSESIDWLDNCWDKSDRLNNF
jgi:hypothetical protein